MHFILVTPYTFHGAKYFSYRDHAVAPEECFEAPRYLQYRDFLWMDEQAVCCFWLQLAEAVTNDKSLSIYVEITMESKHNVYVLRNCQNMRAGFT